jgi:branched-chain amino acid aminotransferase
MIAFLNGRFVPEEDAKVSIFDRAFLYGDGLFETLRVCGGRPFRWSQHMRRLAQGAELLGMALPFPATELAEYSAELIRRAAMPDALLRITLSRGVGPRGYSPRGARQPLLAMSIHPAPGVEALGPRRWRLITAAYILPAGDLLAVLKTCNKLPQILARAQAEASGADEALLLNTDGKVAEASSGNVFWVDGERICTPPLTSGSLAGVTRAVVFEIGAQLGIPCVEQVCLPSSLHEAAGVFLTLSSLGILEVESLDARVLSRSSLTLRLHHAYQELVAHESR